MTTMRDVATQYIHCGISPIPVPYKRKKPVKTGWPELRIGLNNVDEYFNGTQSNIGALLGIKGLTDTDLDCTEARMAGEILLPPTGFIYGRKSAPHSHRFYSVDGEFRSKEFKDPILAKRSNDDEQDNRATLLELRSLKKDGTVGHQSLLPPSVHDKTGEVYEWSPGSTRIPQNVDAADLIKAASKTAAAALLGRYFAKEGGRHDAFLALAGVLVRAGWPKIDALEFHRAIYSILWPGQVDYSACKSEVETTFEKYQNDRNAQIYGIPTLKKLIDGKVVDKVLDWLGISGSPKVTASQEEGESGDWHSQLIPNKDGSPAACLANAITALRCAPEWMGALGWNEFALKTVSFKCNPWKESDTTTEWTDTDDIRLTDWLQHQGIRVNVQTAGQAVQAVAKDRTFNPLRNYLNGLIWDGVERLTNWLPLYLGTENSAYMRAVGPKFCISAVARVFVPGEKVDCCPILEGPQGVGKSTTVKTLFGAEFYTDEIADLGSKDSALQVAGVWVIELGELDSLSRAETGRIKAFISRSTDRFRPPYGKRPEAVPRQCVFMGTVNHDTYLKDETGARRFWPVRCGRIDIASLARDRDQLWAEAVHRYRAGEKWWLDTKELVEAAAIEQADRYESDPWEAPIRRYIETLSDVSIDQILRSCIGKTTDKMPQPDQNRVARCLRALGWERFNARTDEGREWRYRRASR